MRRLALLLFIVLLSACSGTEIESDPASVFAVAFGAEAPPRDVIPLHGYRIERRKFFTTSEHMWRLHIKGPGAKQFVRKRWPDLVYDVRRVFFQGTQTPWFAPSRELKYSTLVSKSDPSVTVMESDDSDEVFIAYDMR